MRVGVQCHSVLLQKSLETFLGEHLAPVARCDVLISDEALVDQGELLRVGSDSKADIIKPFSKSQLFFKLEQFYKNKEELKEVQEITQELDEVPLEQDGSLRLDTLEDKINRLTAQYVKGVLSIVRENYEK